MKKGDRVTVYSHTVSGFLFEEGTAYLHTQTDAMKDKTLDVLSYEGKEKLIGPFENWMVMFEEGENLVNRWVREVDKL